MALIDDETPRIGSVCIDTGRCHHHCDEASGCFRRSCCVPLSISGLDDFWRTPAEAARSQAQLIAQDTLNPDGALQGMPIRL
jgi:hypothetical protein